VGFPIRDKMRTGRATTQIILSKIFFFVIISSLTKIINDWKDIFTSKFANTLAIKVLLLKNICESSISLFSITKQFILNVTVHSPNFCNFPNEKLFLFDYNGSFQFLPFVNHALHFLGFRLILGPNVLNSYLIS